jgi:hypothetical protein
VSSHFFLAGKPEGTSSAFDLGTSLPDPLVVPVTESRTSSKFSPQIFYPNQTIALKTKKRRPLVRSACVWLASMFGVLVTYAW